MKYILIFSFFLFLLAQQYTLLQYAHLSDKLAATTDLILVAGMKGCLHK